MNVDDTGDIASSDGQSKRDNYQPSAKQRGDNGDRGDSHDWSTTGVYDDKQLDVDEENSPNNCPKCGKYFDNLVDGDEHYYTCTGDNEGGDSPRDSGEEGTRVTEEERYLGGVGRGDTMEVDSPRFEIPNYQEELIQALADKGCNIDEGQASLALVMNENDIKKASEFFLAQFSAFEERYGQNFEVDMSSQLRGGDEDQTLSVVSPRPLAFAGHICPLCINPFECPAVLQTTLVGDTITKMIEYLPHVDQQALSQCSKFYHHYVKTTLMHPSRKRKSLFSKTSRNKRTKLRVVDQDDDEMREAIENSLRETHGNRGDEDMQTELIYISLPRGNLDFSLTESSGGMCIVGQLPVPPAAAASTSATSVQSSDVERGDVILSMNGIDFEGLGGVLAWDELLQSAKERERTLLVCRPVVPDVGNDVDFDVLSLPFCQVVSSPSQSLPRTNDHAISELAKRVNEAKSIQLANGRDGRNAGGHKAGDHCGKTKNGDWSILGHTKESLSRLQLLDLSSKPYTNPDTFRNHCIRNKLVATKNLDQNDLTLVKAVTSSAVQGDSQFVSAGKRASCTYAGPRQFSQSHPPGYNPLPTDAGQVFANKLKDVAKSMTGNACPDMEPRVYSHFYDTPVNEFLASQKAMMDKHADGMNKDGDIFTARQTMHIGGETNLVLTPVLVIPDSTASHGYRIKSLWASGQGAVFPMGTSSKTILNFYGSGRGLLGLAWFEGQLAGVGLYHSVHPAADAGSELRIMLATDLHSPSLQHHEGLVERWVSGTLCKKLPVGLLSPEMVVSVKSIHEDLLKIKPFLPSDVIKCRENDCHRMGSYLDIVNGGMGAFQLMQTGGGREIDPIRPHLTCTTHATSTSRTLCDCQRGFPLAQTTKCASCGPSRCQGCNVANGNEKRVFRCKNRSVEEVTNNIGVLLDDSVDGNMNPNTEMYKCRSCSGGNCKYPDCTKSPEGAGGLCTAHGGKRKKKKECKYPDCTKQPVGAGGMCRAHGGKLKNKAECKYPDCTKCPVGAGGMCRAHGGKRKKCKRPGCEKYPRKGGLCIAHGGEK